MTAHVAMSTVSCALWAALATGTRTRDRLLLLSAGLLGAAVYLAAAMVGL